jgi:hypothetical protein
LPRWFALGAALVGCSYPQFAFEQAVIDGSSATDTLVAETAADDTLVEDTFISADTTTVVDTSVADVVDSTPPPPMGCTGSTALFCIDFSKAVEAHDGWTSDKLSPGSTLQIENTAPFSAPNNLIAFVKADTMGYPEASVAKLFTAPTLDRVARIDFRLKVPAKPGPGGRYLLVRYHRADAGDGISFTLDGTGFYLEVHGGSYSEKRAMTPVPADTWIHVRMDAVLKYSGGSVRAWIDDMTTPVAELTAISTTETDSLDRRIDVGIFANTPPNDLWARYDDVSFDWK